MNSNGHKRLSCGVVVTRHTRDGPLFLLLRSFHLWDFPKGMIETGETPLQAALREVREETALEDIEFPWGDSFVETGPYSRGKTARYYLGRTHQSRVILQINPEIGRAEHTEFRWVEFADAMRLTTPRVRPVVSWAAGCMLP